MEPLKTDHLGTWLKRAGFMEGMRTHTAWITSTEWAEIAKEIEALNLASETPIIVMPTNKNFNALRIAGGKLILRNSGTEDQEWCNQLNWDELGTDAILLKTRAQQLFPVARIDEEKKVPILSEDANSL